MRLKMVDELVDVVVPVQGNGQCVDRTCNASEARGQQNGAVTAGSPPGHVRIRHPIQGGWWLFILTGQGGPACLYEDGLAGLAVEYVVVTRLGCGWYRVGTVDPEAARVSAAVAGAVDSGAGNGLAVG